MDQSSQIQIMRRPVRAFIFTPVFAAPLYLFLGVIWHGPPFSGTDGFLLFLLPFIAIRIGMIMVVLALPLYFLLRDLKLESALITIVLAGGVAAVHCLFFSLIAFFDVSSPSPYSNGGQADIDTVRVSYYWAQFWEELILETICGLFGGVVFWRLYSGRWV